MHINYSNKHYYKLLSFNWLTNKKSFKESRFKRSTKTFEGLLLKCIRHADSLKVGSLNAVIVSGYSTINLIVFSDSRPYCSKNFFCFVPPPPFFSSLAPTVFFLFIYFYFIFYSKKKFILGFTLSMIYFLVFTVFCLLMYLLWHIC